MADSADADSLPTPTPCKTAYNATGTVQSLYQRQVKTDRQTYLGGKGARDGAGERLDGIPDLVGQIVRGDGSRISGRQEHARHPVQDRQGRGGIGRYRHFRQLTMVVGVLDVGVGRLGAIVPLTVQHFGLHNKGLKHFFVFPSFRRRQNIVFL